MKVVVQRVREASVSVGGRTVASIGRGFLVLAGFGRDDGEAQLSWMARKVASLRVFEDEAGRMSLPLSSVDGRILVVSQFTLHGDCKKGARASTRARRPRRRFASTSASSSCSTGKRRVASPPASSKP
jgi:D-tyrosyl-tRNA(Tyr) deacylase